MSLDPPKTPPAWFAQYVRRQEAQQVEINSLKSRVGASALASGHQVGELAKLITDFRDEVRGAVGELKTAVAAVKESIADQGDRISALETHIRGPK